MSEKTSSSSGDLREQITRLGELEPWFHCIDFGEGVFTREPVEHLEKLWNAIEHHVPQNLDGLSALDIGCNAGFFSTSLKKKNAASVMGIDMSPNYLRQAKFVADALQLDIHYQLLSIYDIGALGKKFDLVLCLGVIYHLINPFEAARAIWSVANKLAVIESAVIPDDTERPLWELVFPGFDQNDHAGVDTECCYNWWFPNMAGLKTIFLKAGFRSAETIYRNQDRGAIICRK